MKKLENMSHFDRQVIKRAVVEIEEGQPEKISKITIEKNKNDVESVLFPHLKEKRTKLKEESRMSKFILNNFS